MLVKITNDSLQEYDQETVVIDFGATWCGPCTRFAPVFAISCVEHNEYTHLTVDVDANPELAAKFNIMSIPTVVITTNGNEIGRIGNPGTLVALKKFISDTISN